MSYTAAERETVIQMDDESDVVRIWSAQRTQITRMRKKDQFTELRSGNDNGSEWAEFTIPRSLWNVDSGVKRTRVMTDEQREAAAGRMREMARQKARREQVYA